MFEVHFKKATESMLTLKKNFYLTIDRAKKIFGMNFNTSLFFRGNSFDTKQYNGLDLTEEQVDKARLCMMKDS
jgi:hypothetical protein